ncbi:MAG: GDP-mannose 4,6-dehydratase [Anaerolineales bacterium]|nr:GDP-mannose 4,6-dehydratase [Anaerolineales bacterium]
MNKIAIITGIEGQVGSYLAEYLLSLNYKVIGLKRRSSLIKTDRIDHLLSNPNFQMEFHELNDAGATYRLILKHKPDEIYNLACQSHVRVSFEVPEETVSGIVMGTLTLLEAVRNLEGVLNKSIKFFQASTSEMFGVAPCPSTGYSEISLMLPASPYACAKLCAHHLVRNYRESYGLFACSGILFNHESERRGETFVTRKITLGIRNILAEKQKKIVLGNLKSFRDWGYSKDYVRAQHFILQQDKSDDFVVSTGETHSIEEFLDEAFQIAGLGSWKSYVDFDKKYERPQEVPYLLGDSTKLRNLGWKPETTFKHLVKIMVENDIKDLKKK